jgi:hypothetical protein
VTEHAEKRRLQQARNDYIFDSWVEGRSLKDLAEEHRVTAGRIREIIHAGKFKRGQCFNYSCERPTTDGKMFCQQHLSVARQKAALNNDHRRIDASIFGKPGR